jgi:signal transduction histidine kinase
MKNLKNTKIKLTIIFTLIISILFLIIWNSFFIFKFYSDKENINNTYKKIEKIILQKENEINTFIKNNWKLTIQNKQEKQEIENILNFTKKLFKNPDINFWDQEKTTKVEEILVEWKSDFPFFNEKIIIFNNDNSKNLEILYSNIEESEKIDFKKYLNSTNWILFEKKLAIIKTTIWKNTALIFINRKYSSSDLLFDIWYLILWVIFFSLIFYFIWNIFVKKVLKPVEENIDEMNNFIDNAWHELKTPLAAINSSAWLLKEMKTFDPELIQEVIDETNKSNEIIWALRSLTKISKNAKTEIFSIKPILKEILISQKDKIKEKNIKLEFNTKNKDIELEANKNYFYILASNIITNAIKYNKEFGKLVIKIENNSLIITDTWIWIPKEETKKVFERFYRTKNHTKVEWHGLWLSMVEKIAKIYNWKIDIESIEDMWTKVIIKF